MTVVMTGEDYPHPTLSDLLKIAYTRVLKD